MNSGRQWWLVLALVASVTAQAADKAAKVNKADKGDSGGRPVASPPSPITDRFAVRLGVWSSRLKTEGRIDPNNLPGAGTAFNAERDFGLADRETAARGEAMFRMRERLRLRLSDLEITRRGSQVLAQGFQFGNQTFLAGERLDSRHYQNSVDFSILYSMLRAERVELGLGIGIHLMQTEIEGTINRPTGAAFERFSASGPYPDLAADVSWRITRRFAATARAQVLQVQASGVTAHVGDYHADLQFRMKPYLAVGLGYQDYTLDVNAPADNPAGRARLDFRGPELFLRASL